MILLLAIQIERYPHGRYEEVRITTIRNVTGQSTHFMHTRRGSSQRCVGASENPVFLESITHRNSASRIVLICPAVVMAPVCVIRRLVSPVRHAPFARPAATVRWKVLYLGRASPPLPLRRSGSERTPPETVNSDGMYVQFKGANQDCAGETGVLRLAQVGISVLSVCRRAVASGGPWKVSALAHVVRPKSTRA